MAYLVICFFFGLAGGIVGKVKGSSFFIWFLISAVLPVAGLLAALLYRFEQTEPAQPCPRCGKPVKLHDSICTRCGEELYFPGALESAAEPVAEAR